MKALSGVHDLMALATIRRLLLELGYVLHPEAAGNVLGPLQLWMREPLSQFDGQSPLEVLAGGDGEKRVRECLAEMSAANDRADRSQLLDAEPAQG